MKTRVFKHFPKTTICPVCGTNEDRESVLIPIVGTQEGNICQAQPFHWDCAAPNAFDPGARLIYKNATFIVGKNIFKGSDQ